MQAVLWHERAADAGCVKSQLRLGFCYAEGNGTPKNPGRGAAWFLRAAEAGCGAAQLCLAKCFMRGDGVSKDFVQARSWLGRAAASGIEKAKPLLAIFDAAAEMTRMATGSEA